MSIYMYLQIVKEMGKWDFWFKPPEPQVRVDFHFSAWAGQFLI